jgi:RNA polymerase sigma-70 factor (ECF subfamily)
MQRERLKEVQSFAEYIYVVGRNQVISAMRKKVAKICEEPDDVLEADLVPDKQMQYKETYELIMEGMERLTPQQQLIFKMSRFEGLSYMDIAARLNLSKNTVKGHMVLALNFMRTFIREHLGHTLFVAVFTWYFL